MKVRIENIADGICKIDKEVSEEQYYFLKDLFKELNENYDRDCYSPKLSLKVIYQPKNTPTQEDKELVIKLKEK